MTRPRRRTTRARRCLLLRRLPSRRGTYVRTQRHADRSRPLLWLPLCSVLGRYAFECSVRVAMLCTYLPTSAIRVAPPSAWPLRRGQRERPDLQRANPHCSSLLLGSPSVCYLILRAGLGRCSTSSTVARGDHHFRRLCSSRLHLHLIMDPACKQFWLRN